MFCSGFLKWNLLSVNDASHVERIGEEIINPRNKISRCFKIRKYDSVSANLLVPMTRQGIL
jgi:hypothetical protein